MRETNSEYSDAQIKRAEEVITLHRRLGHPSFDNMKKFNEIREENEKTATKIQEDSKEQKTNWD